MGPLAPIEIFLYVVNQIDSMLSYVCSEVGSITSRCSGKEPAFPSRGGTQPGFFQVLISQLLKLCITAMINDVFIEYSIDST